MLGKPGGASGPPKISGLQLQSTGLGNPIQIVYGKNRVWPILGWYDNFKSEKLKSGKGGGKSGGASFAYYADIILFVCRGAIKGFGKSWRDKEKTATTSPKPFEHVSLGAPTYTGWPYLQTKFPAKFLKYRGLAYVAAARYPLRSGAALGNHSLEVFGLKLGNTGAQNEHDAHVSDVIDDFLLNAHYGAIDTRTYNLTLNLSRLHEYCVARSLLISPVLSSRKPAAEWLTEWALVANCGIVWSEGVLKFVPYADEFFSNGFGSFTPDTTIRHSFDDNNLGAPVKPEIKNPADCHNVVPYECLSRERDYSKFAADVKDDAGIAEEGLKTAPVLKLDSICFSPRAKIVALTQLQRGFYIRKVYTLKTFCTGDADLLEPMDFITLTDAALGLSAARCRIVSIEDMADGNMTIKAEEAPVGVYCG